MTKYSFATNEQGNEKRRHTSTSEKAGLLFPVGRIKTLLKEMTGMRVSCTGTITVVVIMLNATYAYSSY